MRVIVIVLNWNNTTDVIETIESLTNQDYREMEIVIVDNHSSNGVAEYIKDLYPNLTYIDNSENLGWAGGNNVGINYALNANGELVILANNDIYIDDRFLISKIVQNYKMYANSFDILGVKIMDYFKRSLIQQEGTTIFNNKGDRFMINDYIPQVKKVSTSINYFDAVSGAFMVISRKAIQGIGLIDEKFFMYGEETEYSLRGWFLGYKSAVDSTLIVYHKGAVSSGKGSPFVIYYKTRNLYYLLRKHKKYILNYPYFRRKLFFVNLKQLVKFLLKKEYTFQHVLMLMKGIIHGALLGTYGRNPNAT